MKVEDFLNIIDADFFTGVPDSLLKSLTDTQPLFAVQGCGEI